MKILIFSDIHIACHKKSTERLQHCLDSLEWVFNTAEDKNIKNIIFCGDLFHDRQKIDVFSYHKTFEIFLKRVKNLNIYLLLGNHDLWFHQKTDISSVYPLQAIKGVNVIDKPSTVNVDGFEVSFLPYTHNPIEDLKKIQNNNKFKILFGHIAVDGAVWNTLHGTYSEVSIEHDGDMVKVDDKIFNNWDQVFLGHYHAEQKLNERVEYVGSPFQLSFGEAFQEKHIIQYDLKTHEKEYILNKFSPKHLIIKQKDIKKYNLNNNFVRLMVDDISDSQLIETRNELTNNYKFGSLEIKQLPKSVKEDQKSIEDAKKIFFKEDEMLKRWIEELKPNLNNKKLIDIGNMICFKGE